MTTLVSPSFGCKVEHLAQIIQPFGLLFVGSELEIAAMGYLGNAFYHTNVFLTI